MEGNEFTRMFLEVPLVRIPLMLLMIRDAGLKTDPPLKDLANPMADSSPGQVS
jgi:hypothetical protein